MGKFTGRIKGIRDDEIFLDFYSDYSENEINALSCVKRHNYDISVRAVGDYEKEKSSIFALISIAIKSSIDIKLDGSIDFEFEL